MSALRNATFFVVALVCEDPHRPAYQSDVLHKGSFFFFPASFYTETGHSNLSNFISDMNIFECVKLTGCIAKYV